MPPHLHPRSRSTMGLFAGTLLASLLVVGLPHVFPCPSPRRTFADSEMILSADGRQIPRVRRRRRKDVEAPQEGAFPTQPAPIGAVDDEVSTFFQMENEAEELSRVNHECPIPKPKGVLGELLGFRNVQANSHQTTGLHNSDQ